MRRISEDLNLAKSTIFRAFNELEENGLPCDGCSAEAVRIFLCQIAVGSPYMFGIPRGYTDGFYSWFKQVIVTCLTAFLQTTILYIGLLTYTQQALLAVKMLLGKA